MAQKRMIDKKISVSEQVANLPRDGQCMFTWLIVHADDLGLLPGSPRTLKAMAVPMWKISDKKIEELVASMVHEGLLALVEIDGQQYYQIPKFSEHQSLRDDRQPQTVLPIKLDGKPEKSWTDCNNALKRLKVIKTDGNATALPDKTPALPR